MASNMIADLDSQLASLNQLKPPGASKGKITSITQLCVNNIQSESLVVQSLYRALKKAPATHKLGALYVIDSVVRQWIERAKQSGQDLNFDGRGEPGTYAAAVKRVTELITALFDDIMKGIPAEQKPKLDNMVGIWEKGSTFPASYLADFKKKLSGASSNASPQTNGGSTAVSAQGKFKAPIPTRLQTPVGFPPQYLYDQGFLVGKGEPQQAAQSKVPPTQQTQAPLYQAPAASAPSSDVNSILAALANAVPKPAAPQQHHNMQPVAPPPPVSLAQQLPPEIAALFGQQGGVMPFAQPPQQPPTQLQAYPIPPQQGFPSMPINMPMPGFQPPPNFMNFPPQPPPSIPQQYAVAPPPPQPTQAADPLAPLRGILPANIINDQAKLVMALNLLQDLQKQGLPMDQWGPILQAFDESSSPSQTSRAMPTSHDRGRDRDRSRSPDRGGKRRASPVYGSYEEVARRQGNEDRSGHGRYRQRSPMPMREEPMREIPGGKAMNGMPMQPKYIAIDNNLPPNNIKVLSRTLFVGGANGTQAEIQHVFERFGRVQTCIANRDKRHAFVKMTTRTAALAAKAGMEELQKQNDREVMNVARQTKWGVGFGPRECCDYAQGESIIPIHKLTEADMKWLLTAEYGGTGGKQVEGGMVLEEPDIEIGAGVSSKAMSKRVDPDTGAPNNKRHNRDERGSRHKGGHRNDGGHHGGNQGYGGINGGGAPPPMPAYGYTRPEPVAVATPPAVPTFGFTLAPTSTQPPFR